MTSTAVWVDDMHCAACSSKIERALANLPGIEHIRINPVNKQVYVSHERVVAAREIIQSIEALGFHPKLASAQTSTQSRAQDQTLLKRVGVAGICMMQIMMLQIALYAGAFDNMSAAVQSMLSYVALMFCLPVICYAAVPFFVKGLLQPLQARGNLFYALNMDTPIASAMLLAFSVSLVNTLTGAGEIYFDSVAMFAFLMLATRYIDQRLRGQLAVEKSLLSNLPAQVQRIENGKPTTVALTDIHAGDRVWVTTGTMIPADGSLVSDEASIDEALLTGEAEPVLRGANAQVFAGTINVGPGIEITVSDDVDHSRLAEMDQIAADAASQKPMALTLTDTIARIFVPSILLLALLTYLGWTYAGSDAAISTTLAVLIISCPCALSLAVPAAINAGLGRLRRLGVLVKNPAALERATELTHVHFDKTGTLTHPDAKLVNTRLLGALDQDRCLALAAALQVHSPHPIARAFHSYYSVPAEDVEVLPGQGIRGTVDRQEVRIGLPAFSTNNQTSGGGILLSVDFKPVAEFQVEHPVRADAEATISHLTQAGLSCDIVSGDQIDACEKVAKQLHITCTAATDPLGKQALVSGKNSLFVGDGLNDLIAMSSAPVSIATMETVDLVKSRADAILMSSRLDGVAAFIRTGRRVRQIIRQNLAWALLYNLIAIPLAISGLAPPWLAAAGMSASSLLVLGNATRVLQTKENT